MICSRNNPRRQSTEVATNAVSPSNTRSNEAKQCLGLSMDEHWRRITHDVHAPCKNGHHCTHLSYQNPTDKGSGVGPFPNLYLVMHFGFCFVPYLTCGDLAIIEMWPTECDEVVSSVIVTEFLGLPTYPFHTLRSLSHWLFAQ